MFRSQDLARPSNQSLFGTAAATALVMLGSQTSALIGYFLALSALVVMIIGMNTGSIWPTRAKKENSLVFSLFWGLMLGAIAPFLVNTFLEGGVSGVVEMLMSDP